MTDIENIVYQEIRNLFNTTQTLSHETSAFDVDGWDSLNYSVLIINLEDKLHLRLPEDEIFGLDNVGQLIKLFESQANKGE